MPSWPRSWTKSIDVACDRSSWRTPLAATLRHTATLVYYERVTSDTTTGLGKPQRITIPGGDFLATEPYPTGRATTVNSVSNPDRTTTLLLAYPSQGIHVDLTLDPTGTLLRETLTGPDHLITRTFIQPEQAR